MKNRPFRSRLGFALAGILTVTRRERSFRTQCALGAVAVAVTAATRPGFVWSAIVALAVALVLALELLNAALEYLMDHLHPELAEEIGHAKDAAAGAVLLGAIGALCVGALMMISEAGS